LENEGKGEKESMKKCKVEGCNSLVKSGGYCSKHDGQVRKFGKILERTIYDPNEFIVDGEICRMNIFDKSAKFKCQVLIDAEDLEKVSAYKWYFDHSNRMVSNNEIGYLSRFIMNVTDFKMKVDHINQDRLDNRKENLRLCTNSENCRNRGKQTNNTSGYKGVYWNKKNEAWIAAIKLHGKFYHIGCFPNKKSAAKAYNKAALIYHGEFALLNEIQENENDY
jgi:hypothetical protein